MIPFSRHSGVAAPLRRADVDTDQICDSRFLKRITKTGYDDALFATWRTDPGFVLNQEPFRNASVLLVGPNFGSGSSREHAVWALHDYGFRVIVGSRFADIFRGNAGKHGLVLATLAEDEIDFLGDLIEAAPGTTITTDLETQELFCGGRTLRFDIDAHTRSRLLLGLDEIAETLQNDADIVAFEQSRPSWKARIA